MAPLVLEGDTLGKKHRHYNKLLREALKTDSLPELSQDDDIQNLLHIEIASNNRNVEYILEVLKSEDQLYVSKALKRSTWLFTDPHYAHIINPEHLYTKLYPQMTSRSFNKLMLNIRLHLKDEKRVEEFYNYIKEKDIKSAYKWLQHCSVPFIEIEVDKNNRAIPDYIVQRLFEKSFSIFKVYTNTLQWVPDDCKFVLKKNAETFLDILERLDRIYFTFNAKSTKILMEKCPQRVLDKFEKYGTNLHMATFAKYLNNSKNVKDFLVKHVSNPKLKWLYTYENIKHFLKYMPKEGRFEFVKKIFIDKEINQSEEGVEEDWGAYSCYRGSSQNTNSHQWYKFAPFATAFTDLKKLIRAENNPEQRNLMLQVLVLCARKNVQHIHTVLQYYYDKHINEPFKFKIQFVNYFIAKVDTHTIDAKTWNLLIQLFHSMEVFINSENNVQSCLNAIIVRNSIQKEQVPDIVKNKFVYETLKRYQTKLKKQEEKDAVFEYLRNYIATKSDPLNLTIESEFNEAVTLCEHLLNLIKDWDKEIFDHPYALNRIKELTKVKKEKSWNADLSTLYNLKKSWKKAMFEESIVILPNEEVFVNALKHDPGLLSRNKEQVVAITSNDTVSLTHLLRKIRIYWPSTLTEDWKSMYLNRLDKPGGHKALIIGLCALLPQQEVIGLLEKYAPSETKIDWNETDQLELSLRKQIAKNIHKTRTPVPVDGILLYAKGDYLQYAVPSLTSVLSQLSPNKSRQCIPKLMDAPVSLQKFGVRCAFQKLGSEELKPLFSELWNSTKNSSIRTVLFTNTYNLLCKEKNESYIKGTWDLLCMFIEKLTPDESKPLYQKLGVIYSIPDSVKGQFYMKSYTFLSSLPAKCNCENILNRLQSRASEVMEFLDDDFVVNFMLKKFNENFIKENNFYENSNVMSSFILTPKDEQSQIRRYKMSLSPLLEKYLPLWDSVHENEYRVKRHVKYVLGEFIYGLRYAIRNNTEAPIKVYEAILNKLENTLSYQKDYTLLTSWKLVVAFLNTMKETDVVAEYYKKEAEFKSITDEDKEKIHTENHKKMAVIFAKTCVKYIKEDGSRFGLTIYGIFSKAFTKLLNAIPNNKLENQLEYIKSLLRYENEKEVWLMCLYLLDENVNNLYTDGEKENYEEIRKIALSHPSDEIRMHYHALFADVVPYTKGSKE